MRNRLYIACFGRRRAPRRGAILLFVLGLIFFMTLILAAFLEEAVDQIRFSGQFQQQDDLRAEAYSYLEVSLAVLAELRELDGGLFGGAQGWNNPLAYAGVGEPPDGMEVAVRITDESGKFPLSPVDEDLLRSVLEEIGLDKGTATDLTGYFIDWTDPDDLPHITGGAEEDEYQSREPPYYPANAPLSSWEELRLIAGFEDVFFDENGLPNDYYRLFREAFSLHNRSPVNENTSTAFVRQVQQERDGFDRRDLDEFLAGDDGERGTGDDGLLLEGSGGYVPEGANLQGNTFRVEVLVQRGASRFLLSALVSLGSGPTGSPAAAARSPEGGEGEKASREARGEESSEDLTAPPPQRDDTVKYPFTILSLRENARIG